MRAACMVYMFAQICVAAENMSSGHDESRDSKI